MAGRTLVATFTGNTTQLEASTKKANTALASVGKTADKQSSGIKKTLAALGGGALVAGVINFGKSSVKAFTEAEASQAKLTDAFARFPKTADLSVKALQDYNSELAKKTKFDDDALASGEAVLAQFDLTGKQIKDLTPLLADYAAKTGKDLPDAALDLGKAIQGQGRALKAVGLNLTDTGSATGNLEQLTKGLRTQVGGFAEKEGKTAAGQAEILKNQFGELQENVGAKLVPALQKLAAAGLKIIDFMQRNATVIKPLVVAVGGFAVAIYAVNTATKAWEATTKALATVMGIFTTKTEVATVATEEQGAAAAASGKKMAGMGKAMGIAGIALAGLFIGAEGIKAIQRATDDAVPGLEKVKAGLLEVGKSGDMSKLGKDFNDLGSNLDRIFNKSRGQAITDTLQTPFTGIFGKSGSLRQAESDLKAIDDALASLVSGGNAKQAADAFAKITEKAKKQGVSVDQLKKMFPGYEDALAGVKNESTLAATGQGTFTDKTKAATAAAADQKKGLDDLKQSFDDIIKANFGVSDATDAYAQDLADLKGKIADARKAGDEHATSLKGQSQAARDNRAAVEGLVADSGNLIKAWIDAGDSGANLNKKIEAQKTALYNTLVQMGFTKAEARRYANTLNGIKSKVATNVTLTTADARAAIAAFQRYVNSRAFKIKIQAEINVTAVKRPGAQIAGGGAIRGPGGPRSDVIPAWLSNGEYVINAASARRIGVPALNRLNRMATGGTVPRLATGGGVTAGRARGSDGATVNVNALLANPAETGRAVVEALRAYERAAGHGWRLGNDLGAA